MILRAPQSWLTALLNGIANGSFPLGVSLGGPGNAGTAPPDVANRLKLVRALAPNAGQLAEYVGPPFTGANGTSVTGTPAVAALITPSSQSVAAPATDTGPWWLSIPAAWARVLAGAQASSMPSSGPLQLSMDCAIDAQGPFIAAFQALGFTGPFVPVTNGPVPVVGG